MFILSKDGCWECISHSKNRKGYIDICRNSKRTKIHRYIYEQVNGIVLSDDVVVMHKCDNPACINPNHLDVGDIDKNNKDKTAKNRQVKGESVHTAKLTSNDVARIKIDDRSQRQIALDYGVCHSTIGRIKRRENWKHEDFSLQRRNVG